MKNLNPLRVILPKLGATTELPARDDLETRVAEEPVWYIPSPEGSPAAYDAPPAHIARVVEEAVENGVFENALSGLPQIDA